MFLPLQILPPKLRGIVLGFALRCRENTIEHQHQRSPAMDESLLSKALHLVDLAKKHTDLEAKLLGKISTQSDNNKKASKILSDVEGFSKEDEHPEVETEIQQLKHQLTIEMGDLRKQARNDLESAVIIYDEKVKDKQSHSSGIKAAEARVVTAEEKLMSAVELSDIHFRGALCIGFDTESQGFPSALVRVFHRVSYLLDSFYSALLNYCFQTLDFFVYIYYRLQSLSLNVQVGFINFSSWYEDYQEPLRIDVDDSYVFCATTPHDILMRDGQLSYKLPLVNHLHDCVDTDSSFLRTPE